MRAGRARALVAVVALAAPAAAHADGLGIDPSQPRSVAGFAPSVDPASLSGGGGGFQFHGFLRVPLRIGFGGGGTHVPPQIPDGTYTDPRFTNVAGGPWAEVWLSYDTGSVKANVVLAAFDFSDASYRNSQAQMGISQAFLTFDRPRLFGDRGGLTWNVGAFAGRYGAAGRYDAGKYDTYLFGATHVAGETVTARFRLTPSLVVVVDHGIGAKLQVAPLSDLLEPFLPYPGPVQQGSTLLHHAHAGVVLGDHVTIAGHYLTSWTDDARGAEVDGRITNVGADVKVVGSRLGDGYLGVAHLDLQDPLRVAGAFEVLHSFEGWSLRNSYFGPNATGTGTIDTVLAQWTFSLARFLWAPQEFWGQGPDLVVAGFGMFNRVASDDPAFDAPTERLKLGGEVTYTPASWLGLDLRYDLVQPDLADNTQSFHVISPSLILRSAYASHEEVVIGTSHYVHGENVSPAYPHEGLAPDEHVLRISASMWW